MIIANKSAHFLDSLNFLKNFLNFNFKLNPYAFFAAFAAASFFALAALRASCFFCFASAVQHAYVQAHHVIVAVGIQSRPGTLSSTMATAAPAFELNNFFMSAALACDVVASNRAPSNRRRWLDASRELISTRFLAGP